MNKYAYFKMMGLDKIAGENIQDDLDRNPANWAYKGMQGENHVYVHKQNGNVYKSPVKRPPDKNVRVNQNSGVSTTPGKTVTFNTTKNLMPGAPRDSNGHISLSKWPTDSNSRPARRGVTLPSSGSAFRTGPASRFKR